VGFRSRIGPKRFLWQQCCPGKWDDLLILEMIGKRIATRQLNFLDFGVLVSVPNRPTAAAEVSNLRDLEGLCPVSFLRFRILEKNILSDLYAVSATFIWGCIGQ